MSKFLSLNSRDFIKGLVVAVGTASLTAVSQILQNGSLPTVAQLKTTAIAGLAGGVAYILKNLFTNSNNELGKTETAN